MKTNKLFYDIRNKKTILSSSQINGKIYLITMEKALQFSYYINQGVSEMAKFMDINYIWDAPEKRNVDEQIDIINNAVANGANAIMLAAMDPVRETSVIENAKALGVKIIYVDSPANEPGIVTLATDNYAAGLIAGETIIMELEANGFQSGSIGILGVNLETATTMARESGFRSIIMADGRFTLLNTLYSGGDIILAQSMAQSLITDNSDLVGLFGTNEENTTGVGNSIKESNKVIIGIGFDLTETIQGLIDQGYLKAVLVQNPFTMGYLGLAETMAALNNLPTGPSYINTGITVRTKYTH